LTNEESFLIDPVLVIHDPALTPAKINDLN